jgi:hypothetical protein
VEEEEEQHGQDDSRLKEEMMDLSQIYLMESSDILEQEGGAPQTGFVSSSFSMDYIYHQDSDVVGVVENAIFNEVQRTGSREESPSPSPPSPPSLSQSSKSRRESLRVEVDDVFSGDDFPVLPSPVKVLSPEAARSESIGDVSGGGVRPRGISLGEAGRGSIGSGSGGGLARRATIASNFDRMSNDIASKLAGAKVKIQAKRKYKTYMPYLGQGSSTPTPAGPPHSPVSTFGGSAPNTSTKF